jgi:subtilisin-like proprotein convertase family protein
MSTLSNRKHGAQLVAAAGAAIAITASLAARPNYDYTGAPVPIPDNGGSASADIVVPGGFNVSDVVARFYVTHTYQGDLRFTLTHVETGTTVTLVDRPGSPQATFGFAEDNYGAPGPVYFALTDYAASTYDVPAVAPPGINSVTGNWKSEGSLAAFIGESAAGTWRLTAEDLENGDFGNIENFQIFLNNEAAGACCLANGSCVQATAGNCALQSGTFRGAGVTCANANCPQPSTGACCLPNGTCSLLSQSACNTQAGVYRGDGSVCSVTSCATYYPYAGFSVAIVDGGPVNGTPGPDAEAIIIVNDHGSITDLDVGFFIEHSFQGDLRVRLKGPGGQTVDLVTRPGVAPPKFTPGTTVGFGFGNDNYGTPVVPFICDDESSRGIYDSAVGAPGVGTAAGTTDVQGRWKPIQPLSVFDGTDGFGIWTLIVNDHAAADTGALHDFRLYINRNSGGGPTCYANCDHSSIPPCLNVNDFVCFNTQYAAGSSYANCDLSTLPPILNVNDFVCFNTKFAAGCANPCVPPP